MSNFVRMGAALLAAAIPLAALAQGTMVQPGVDLWQVQPGTSVAFPPDPIPPDFFAPGSQPFFGTIQFAGEPLGVAGPFQLGVADTVIQRKSPLELGAPPSVDQIPIEIVALHLVSVNPIVVQYSMGPPEPWSVRVDLSPVRQAPDGTLDVQKSQPSGGTFDTLLPVRPRFTFTRLSDNQTRVLDDRDWSLQAPPTPWTDAPGCPGDARLLPLLSGPWCLGAQGGLRQPLVLQQPGVQLVLSLAASTPIVPPPQVDPTAVVAASAELGPGCVIGPRARVGNGAVIGPGAVVGARARVGDAAVLGGNAMLADGARLGSGAVVDDGSFVGPGTDVRNDATLGPVVQTGADAVIGANSTVRGESLIGNNASIGRNAALGGEVHVNDGAAIAGGVRVADRATVTGPRLRENIYPCDPPGPLPIQPLVLNDCTALDGVLMGLIGDQSVGEKVDPANEVTEQDPADETEHETDIEDIGEAHDGSGVPDTDWEEDYDCDDFADDAEKEVEAAGYTGTFTVIWELNPDYRWWNSLWTPKWINGHAVTDVHFDDGTLFWFEPQLRSDQPGWRLDLDFDDDGTVETADGPGDTPTDDSRRIEVYDDLQDAEDAGVPID